MKRVVLGIIVAAFAVVPLGSGSVFAEEIDPETTPIDISWPQCGQNLGINKRDFVIVGVNGGLATTTNPCLRDQLAWANQAKGAFMQPKLQLYVNTANPGGLNTASWPKNNTDPLGTVTNNPYGVCNGGDSLSCAWQYGWNRAAEAVQVRFKPAATAAGIKDKPEGYTWWLDVETENTWKSGSQFAYQSNVADLEGMVSYFKSLPNASPRLPIDVGLYSTSYQWGQIVGSAVSSTSNLNGLASWLAGGGTRTGAIKLCYTAPLTARGKVALTQYWPAGSTLDYNFSCYLKDRQKL